MHDRIATVTSPAPTPLEFYSRGVLYNPQPLWNFIPEESYITPHPSGISYFLLGTSHNLIWGGGGGGGGDGGEIVFYPKLFPDPY